MLIFLVGCSYEGSKFAYRVLLSILLVICIYKLFLSCYIEEKIVWWRVPLKCIYVLGALYISIMYSESGKVLNIIIIATILVEDIYIFVMWYIYELKSKEPKQVYKYKDIESSLRILKVSNKVDKDIKVLLEKLSGLQRIKNFEGIKIYRYFHQEKIECTEKELGQENTIKTCKILKIDEHIKSIEEVIFKIKNSISYLAKKRELQQCMDENIDKRIVLKKIIRILDKTQKNREKEILAILGRLERRLEREKMFNGIAKLIIEHKVEKNDKLKEIEDIANFIFNRDKIIEKEEYFLLNQTNTANKLIKKILAKVDEIIYQGGEFHSDNEIKILLREIDNLKTKKIKKEDKVLLEKAEDIIGQIKRNPELTTLVESLGITTIDDAVVETMYEFKNKPYIPEDYKEIFNLLKRVKLMSKERGIPKLKKIILRKIKQELKIIIKENRNKDFINKAKKIVDSNTDIEFNFYSKYNKLIRLYLFYYGNNKNSLINLSRREDIYLINKYLKNLNFIDKKNEIKQEIDIFIRKIETLVYSTSVSGYLKKILQLKFSFEGKLNKLSKEILLDIECYENFTERKERAIRRTSYMRRYLDCLIPAVISASLYLYIPNNLLKNLPIELNCLIKVLFIGLIAIVTLVILNTKCVENKFLSSDEFILNEKAYRIGHLRYIGILLGIISIDIIVAICIIL